MTVEQWMEKNFKHDKPENSRYNGEYRQDRVKYWQVYDRWLDCDKDVDKLWLDYEHGCMWDLIVTLPKEFLTRDLCLTICEEVITKFGIDRVREEYWWVEKDNRLKSHHDTFGWVITLGRLLYITWERRKDLLIHDGHPDFWEIVWKHIPQISTVIETYGE